MTSATQDRELQLGWIAATLWLLPGLLTLTSDMGTPDGRLLGNIAALAFAPLVILLALALGDGALDLLLRLRGDFAGRRVFAAGIGLGALSLGTFLVGSLWIPPAFAVIALSSVLTAVLARRAGGLVLQFLDRLKAFYRSRDLTQYALAAIIITLTALSITRAYVPPLEYDELEYHLGAPASYYRDGRITFIDNNVYAAFPANIEMLFLNAMMLRGGVIEGLALGRLMSAALGLLAAAAIGSCAGALFDRRAALPAAAILLTWPHVYKMTHLAYVEPGLILYAVLALLAAWQYRRSNRDLRHLVLLGLACGLAGGCKYPALLFLAVPAGVWVLAVARQRALKHGAVFAGLVLLVMSPWLVRNAVHTGNPVHPLLGRTLGSRDWSARQEARWVAAHSPGSYPLRETPRSLSLLLFVFLPLVFIRREWRRTAGVLIGLVLLSAAAWFLLTHHVPRFLIPWLMPLVMLSAAGAVAARRGGGLQRVLSLVLVVLCVGHAGAAVLARSPGGKAEHLPVVLTTELELMAGVYELDQAVSALAGHSNYHHPAIVHLNRKAKSRVLFYGEALAFYCTADVEAPTVFDENRLDAIVAEATDGADIARRLRAEGFTHLYVNLSELKRLQTTYRFELEGESHLGYCTLRNPDAFERVLDFLHRFTYIEYPALPPTAQLAVHREIVHTMRHGQPSGAYHPAMAFTVHRIVAP